MTTGRDVVVREKQELARTDEKQFSGAIIVTQECIAQTRQSLALLRQMVKDVLTEGVDYGQVPGVPEEFLWDPGASQITASFNCRFGQPRVIRETMTDTLIAVVVDQPIISLQTGQEVTSCVGAASTSEVKHKYRWVPRYELADWGYVDESVIKTLKTKVGRDNKPYRWRIPNPEPGELLNTIWKIAAKRGRVGAAQLLPGVSSALREKFALSKGEKGDKKKKEPTSDWDIFWSKAKQMGLESDQVHQYLGVKSVTEWVAAGHTLDEAINKIAQALGNKASKQATTVVNDGENEPGEYEDQTDELLNEFDRTEKQTKEPEFKTDPETLTDKGKFYKACFADFPGRFKYVIDILKALGKKENEITDYPAEYKKLAKTTDPAA